jgi:hypothetical protein
VCNGAGRAVRITGLPEMPVRNITLDNVAIRSNRGVALGDADTIRFLNCKIRAQESPLLSVDQSRTVTIAGGAYADAAGVFLSLSGDRTTRIQLIDIDSTRFKTPVELGSDVGADAVSWERTK